MKYIIIAAFALTACNRYAVKPDTAQGTYIALGGDRLVTINSKGDWTWHHKPEEIVVAMARLIGEQDKQIAALTAKAAVAVSTEAAHASPKLGK